MSTTALQGRRMFAVAALIALTVVSPAVLGNVIRTSLLNYNYYYNNGNMTECRLPSPCGWFMYHPVERNFLHYLQVCYCPTGMRCLADRDDVSISCWVYKCKVAPPGTPANPPVEPPM
ncbi:uncharacterized protein [Dermacentor andersoni]|uniref:uncharacterized protein isoform X2 n=1 Tax=Dermacentor andersoni TaxID=34620 RepID=UPI0021556D56|nr:uncharacterized protein LOC126520945 isoform X2 [Dermacentor andersoni]